MSTDNDYNDYNDNHFTLNKFYLEKYTEQTQSIPILNIISQKHEKINTHYNLPSLSSNEQSVNKNMEIANTDTEEINLESFVDDNRNNFNLTQIIPIIIADNSKYCDITEYLNMPQSQAAKKLGMRTSTFSKRWKVASHNRKWPWRKIRKIDQEINCILRNKIGENFNSDVVEKRFNELIKERQKEMIPVNIRIYP